MTSTDIVIVSYKDQSDLLVCMASIKRYCSDYNLIIEDNNADNRGFSKAVNDGIKKGNADFVWLLNSDAIIVNEETQQALINHFSYSHRVGLTGSMQIDPENHDRIAYGGSQRAFPSGIHKGGLLSMSHCQIPEKQTWLNFASVMLRRDMINKIGLLDEKMFLLYSDSSYCYTAREHGYEAWYVPRSQVYHTLKASKGVSEWHLKDMQAFMNKWGIEAVGPNQFAYSDRFSKLDMFP